MVEGPAGEDTGGFGREWGDGGCRSWWVWSSGVEVLEEWFEDRDVEYGVDGEAWWEV